MNAIVDDPALARPSPYGGTLRRSSIDAPALAERRPAQLDRGDTLRVVDGAGLVLRACSGVVWLTEERSARDTMLLPGDTHRVGNAGMTLARAVGRRPARIVVERPAGVAPPRSADVVARGGERVSRMGFGPRVPFLLHAWTAAIRAVLRGRAHPGTAARTTLFPYY